MRPPRRLDRFEWCLLAAFAAFSVWVLALDILQVIVNGRDWTGTDGIYVVDQMQYVAWIRDASHHLLASNLWGIVISGGLTALGIAPTVTLLLWKPVAVVAFFFGARAGATRARATGTTSRPAPPAGALTIPATVYLLNFARPNCYVRIEAARDLFNGSLTPAQARRFVVQSGAHFVLSDCGVKKDLTKVLASLTVSVSRFGCATVYELGPPGQPEGPLAESPRDAAVRATRRQ